MREQVGGLVRSVILWGSGYAVAKGWGDSQLWADVAAGVAAVAMAVWSWKTNSPTRIEVKK